MYFQLLRELSTRIVTIPRWSGFLPQRAQRAPNYNDFTVLFLNTALTPTTPHVPARRARLRARMHSPLCPGISARRVPAHANFRPRTPP